MPTNVGFHFILRILRADSALFLGFLDCRRWPFLRKLPILVKKVLVLRKPEHYSLAESALRNPFMPGKACPRAHSAPSSSSGLDLSALP